MMTSRPSCPVHRGVSWFFQAVAAVILLQTLFFKFSGSAESKFIFETLGVEPWGRVGTGMAELVASILLLWPRHAVFGAILAAGLMGGAITSHLTKLGIVVRDDGGLLFALAVTVLASSATVVWLRRGELPVFGTRLGANHCKTPSGSAETPVRKEDAS
jgi:hypothetical protein